MKQEQLNPVMDIAKAFILETGVHVFLTGKAGTGKTTLLKEILDQTSKRAVVIAPTGVAAINAGGVTIHSLFQFPLTSFIPSNDFCDPQYFTNRSGLAKHQKLKKDRRTLLVELELLIIDEISMVRADLLDAIDYTLRRIRKNPSPFGGVQLLCIGDLFQLAPVVRESQWNTLKTYYESPFFFDAVSWKAADQVTLELEKVYRQDDEIFISLLNRVRHGETNEKDIALLNKQYDENPKASQCITLTTHNRKADKINLEEISKLKTPAFSLKAHVDGNFSENAYPVPNEIILKKGAQVMFIRNHSEGLYFNGKIGVVKEKVGDLLKITFEDENKSVLVGVEEWKNIRYAVNKKTKEVTQEEMGSFKQYPVKLAWAVTVHKSQGLTFDQLIVDLESTFAPGQLYVALSRCRSLEGLKLSSKISQRNIIVDHRIQKYFSQNISKQDLNRKLQTAKTTHQFNKLLTAFEFGKLLAHIESWEDAVAEQNQIDQMVIFKLAKELKLKINDIIRTGRAFQSELKKAFNQPQAEKEIFQHIVKRAEKAIVYFTNEIHKQIVSNLESHIDHYKRKPKVSKYIRLTRSLNHEIWLRLESLYSLSYLGVHLYQNDPVHVRQKLFTPSDDGAAPKRITGETYRITLEMFKDGNTIEVIAKERGMAMGTIESHMSKLIGQDEIKLTDVMDKVKITSIMKHVEGKLDLPSNELKDLIPFYVSYAEIRWIKNGYEKLSKN